MVIILVMHVRRHGVAPVMAWQQDDKAIKAYLEDQKKVRCGAVGWGGVVGGRVRLGGVIAVRATQWKGHNVSV